MLIRMKCMLEGIMQFFGAPPKEALRKHYVINPELVSSGVARMDLSSLGQTEVVEQVESAKLAYPSKFVKK